MFVGKMNTMHFNDTSFNPLCYSLYVSIAMRQSWVYFGCFFVCVLVMNGILSSPLENLLS